MKIYSSLGFFDQDILLSLSLSSFLSGLFLASPPAGPRRGSLAADIAIVVDTDLRRLKKKNCYSEDLSVR